MGIKTENIAAGSAITTHDPPKTSVGEVSPYDPENLLYYHTSLGLVETLVKRGVLGKKGCQSKAIPEKTLQALLQSIPMEEVEQIRAENGNCVVIRFKDGNETRLKWNDRSRAESWTPEMKEKARQKAKRQHAAHITD